LCSIFDLVSTGSTFLSKHSISNAKKESEWFLAEILKCSLVDLYTKKIHLTNQNIVKYKSYLSARSSKKPFQYIINKAPFYGYDFFVDERVLIPRPETELFIHILKKYDSFNRALDIGTGSGCLAITIQLQNIAEHIDAIDSSLNAIQVAEYNKELFKADRVRLYNERHLDFTNEKKYDLIVCNPPYISIKNITTLEKEVLYEPLEALTDYSDGFSFYNDLLDSISTILKRNGLLLLEIGSNDQANYLCNRLSSIGYTYKISNDLQGCQRVIEARIYK